MKKMGKNMLTLMIMALNILLVIGCKSTLKSSSPIITIENIEQISKIQIHAHRMDKTEYPSNKFENLIKDLENAIPLDDTEAKIIMNMYESKFSLEQISLATKKSIAEIEKIIKENKSVLV